jgi:hypothetical protein
LLASLCTEKSKFNGNSFFDGASHFRNPTRWVTKMVPIANQILVEQPVFASKVISSGALHPDSGHIVHLRLRPFSMNVNRTTGTATVYEYTFPAVKYPSVSLDPPPCRTVEQRVAAKALVSFADQLEDLANSLKTVESDRLIVANTSALQKTQPLISPSNVARKTSLGKRKVDLKNLENQENQSDCHNSPRPTTKNPRRSNAGTVIPTQGSNLGCRCLVAVH